MVLFFSMGVNDVNLERPKQATKNPMDEQISRRSFLKLVGKGVVVASVAGGEIAARITGNTSPVQAILGALSKTGEPKAEGTESAEAEDKTQQVQNENQASVQQNNPPQTKQEVQPSSKKPATDQSELKTEHDHGFSRINEIVALRLGSPERLQKEREYVQWAKELEQIKTGFLGVFDTELRGELIDKQATFRVKGDSGSPPLEARDSTWAQENDYDPESLGICIRSRKVAVEFLKGIFNTLGGERFYEIFRPALVHMAKAGLFPQEELNQMMADEDSVESLVINAGALYYIINRETGMNLPSPDLKARRYGFVNLGGFKAADMLTEFYKNKGKPETADKLKEDLIKVFKFLSENGPIKYDHSQIPGSDISGDVGAAQFRPDTLMNELEFFKDNFGLVFNPFSPEGAATLACLFLARDLVVKNAKGEIDYRYGYLKDSKYKKDPKEKDRSEFRKKALIKWNENLADDILKSAEDYYINVVRPEEIEKEEELAKAA